PAASSVDLALIDSGVEPSVAPSVGVVEARSFSSLSGRYHPHGSGMASLIHSVAPNAAIHDLRVLDNNGHTPSGPLANAIDYALFNVRTTGRPLIVNFSLGWPHVFSEYSPLESSSCSTWEDPAGEPTRYLLTGAAGHDLATFVAAAGNDPT